MPNSVLLLLNVIILCSLVQAAMVSYVPNPLCALPAGCDFNNSQIWNTSAVPSQYDYVTIASDEPITIYLNNTNIILQYLSVGYGGNASVSFILYNSVLNLGEDDEDENPNLLWEYDLRLYNSSIFVPWEASGNYLESISGGIYATYMNVANATIINSTCDEYEYYFEASWTLTEVTFTNSYVTPDIRSNILISEDSKLELGELSIKQVAQISGGSLRTYLPLKLLGNASVSILDTTTNIQQILCIGSNNRFSYVANNELASVLLLPFGVHCLNANNDQVLIGDGITANLLSLPQSIGDLTVGSDVILNFGSSGDYIYTTVLKITQQAYVSTPTEINIFDSGFAFVSGSYIANINLFDTSVLYVYNDMVVQGNINGSSIIMSGGSVSSTNIAVQQVKSYDSGIISAEFNFNTSFINCYENDMTVNAPETIVNGSGIELYEYQLSFNGNYKQIGGYINFTGSLSNSGPLITVNGSADLNGVTISGLYMADEDSVIILRSLSKSVTLTNCKSDAITSNANPSRLIVKNGDLVLETYNPTSTSEYFKKHWLWFASIGGAFIIAAAILTIFIIYRRRRSTYVQIPRTRSNGQYA